ncbi:hypothetical protein [Micromonospora sp. SH-82]|uniref:hypothetical protein n=1 Tax=Micromonospora sp. SH-82 TaxID=3132938 RepID=UPI003EBBBF1F
MRVAAGATGPAGGRNLDQRAAAAWAGARTRLRGADRRLGPLLGYASASEYLRLLRPAWWILRGYLAAMLVTVATTGGSFGLLPRLGGSTLAALLLLAVCVVASVWLGRRTPGLGRWPRRAVGAGTAVLVVFALAAFADLDGSRRDWGGGDYGTISVETPYIGDVFVYDSEGRLVPDARLFDQDGNPIRLGDPYCEYGTDPARAADEQRVPTYPHCPQREPFRAAPGTSESSGSPTSGPDPSGTESSEPATPTSTRTAEPTATDPTESVPTPRGTVPPLSTPPVVPTPEPTS